MKNFNKTYILISKYNSKNDNYYEIFVLLEILIFTKFWKE